MAAALRVLYVDDEPDLLELGKLFLEQSGDFTVTTVLSAHEGIQLLDKQKFDVIISDYMMPGLDGIQLLIEVRKRFGSIPFILFTGKGREEVVIQAINSGADFYLQKGGEPESQFAELKNNIKKAVEVRQGEETVRVHQAELEIQAEELKQSKIALEESRDKYLDLYDFAPLGYLMLSDKGLITGVNLTGATLLGVERSRMERGPFSKYIVEKDSDQWYRYFMTVRQQEEKQACTLTLQRGDGSTFPARLESIRISGGSDGPPSVRVAISDISDIWKTNADLIASEEKYRQLVELAKEGIWAIDAGNNTTYVNPRMAEMLQYTVDEMQGRPLVSFMDDAGKKIFAEKIDRRRQGIAEEQPFEFITNGGGRIYVTISTSPLTDDKGAYQGAIAVISDITEQKHAEEGLHESEDRYRTLAESSTDNIFIIGRDDTIRFVNTQAAGNLHLPVNEIIGKPRKNFFHPDIADTQGRYLQTVFETGEPFRGEDKIVYDNQEFWQDTTLVPLRDKTGTVTAVIGVSRDITERKRAEEALIQEKIFSDRLFDAPEDTVFLFEPATGKPVRWNKRFSEVSGYRDDEIAGMKAPDDFYSEDDLKKARAVIDTDVAGNMIVELSLVTKQGAHIPFEYSATAINMKDGRTFLLSIGRNIAGRKRAEEALAASEARVRLSVQSANIGLWDWDLVADTVYFSPEWKGQIGYRDDELPNIFLEWQRRLHPDDLGPTLQTLHAYLANPEGRYEDEFRLMHKDGSYRWINSHADVIRDADGKTVRMLGGHIDITERKRVEAERERASEEIHDLYNNAPCGYHSLDKDGVIVRINDTELTWLGYSREEITGRKKFPDLLTEKSRQRFIEQYFPLFKEQGWIHGLEVDLVRKDGTILPVLVSSVAIKNPDGSILMSRSTLFDNTEHKRAEEALRESEERFRRYFDMPLQGVAFTSTEKGWLAVNDRICSLLGYTRDELFRMTWAEITHPDDLAADVEQFNRLLSGEIEQYTLDKRFIRKDGIEIWTRIAVGCVRKPNGNVDYVVAVMEDITERKAAEGALRESEDRHRTILETAMDGFWLVDMQGRLLEVNEAYCRMSGYSRQELLDIDIAALEASESAEDTAGHIRKTMTQGEDRFGTLHRRKDGSIFNVEISVQYRPVEGGRLIAFLRDITSRRQMEEELRESESFNRGLVENLPDYIIVYGADGKILYANPATERTLGYRPEELIATSLFSYIAPDHHDNAISQMKARSERSEVPPYEIDIVSKDGNRRTVVVKGVPVQYHDNPAVLILLSDITDRKRADDLNRTTLQRLDTLISSLYAGVMTVSEDGIVEHANSAFCDLFNLPDAPGSLIGLAAPALIEKIINAYASPVEVFARIKEFTARGEPVRGEEVTMRDGRVVLVDYIPVIDKDGQRRGRIWHHQDITRRKRADEALQFQGEILEKMAEGVAMVRTGDGVIIYANPRFEFMFGYDHNELAGRQVSSINAPGERDPGVVANEIITSLTQSGIWSGEVHNIRKDGTTFWCYANVSTYEHPQYGQVWVSVQMDISGRKKAEEELVKNRALLDSIIQGTTDAIYVKDLRGRYLLFNPAAEHFTGNKSEDVLGKDDTFLFPAEEAAVVMNGDRRVMTEGELATYEEAVTNSQGNTTTFLSIKGPIFDINGNVSGLFGIARDITGLKQTEAALRESLVEKEVLLKEVHHRVKNNLQIVSGLIFLQSTLTKDLETKSMLTACRNRIVSMALLHENLFQVSNFSSVSMGPYINTIVNYLEDSYDTQKYLAFGVDVPEEINLDIDTGIAIGIIINELATNAIKYAFPSGQSGRMEISLHPSGEGMLLCVRDNGAGLPEGFDLASSPGLGMKLVTNLVRQVHGTMDVKSDHGTTICIAFTARILAGKGQVPIVH